MQQHPEPLNSRIGRGAGGRSPAPRAPRPRAKSCPTPCAPKRPSLACASRPTVDLPDLFCPGQNRGRGWHARESRSCAARHARPVSRACLRAYARRASAHTCAAPARYAARDDIRLDNERCCACVHTKGERAHILERSTAQARNAAHLSLSCANIFSFLSQATDATAFLSE